MKKLCHRKKYLLKEFVKTNRIYLVRKEHNMENYLSAIEISERWNVTPRRIQILCSQNRIKGAVKQSGVWFIPSGAKKPNAKACKQLNVLSLFSGCGGMDLGFEGDFRVLERSVNLKVNPDWKYKKVDDNWVWLEKTRFHTVFANDIKPEAKSAWVHYFSNKGIEESNYYLDSIVDLVKLQKENKINLFPSDVDIVTGGFPCQDFSVSGKRLGFDSDKGHNGKKISINNPTEDNRGQLYMWMREVISITQPKVFVAENVKGLTNLENAKEIIEKDFASVCHGGYLVVKAQVLNAAEYGVSQGRERVIFIGLKKSALTNEAIKELEKEKISNEYNPYPIPTHYLPGEGADNEKLRYVTVGEVILGLEEPEKSTDICQQKYSRAKYMGKHCQGQQEVKLDGIAPTIRSEHHGNIEFRRLSLENGGKYEEELKAGMKERRLTIRECARIQTFPDEYQFIIPKKDENRAVSASEAYKIIGNAVPPLLGYHIAKRLERNWKLYFGKDS